MTQEYEAFVRNREHAVSGAEVVLTLRDLTPGRHKYKGINVRAVISETLVSRILCRQLQVTPVLPVTLTRCFFGPKCWSSHAVAEGSYAWAGWIS